MLASAGLRSARGNREQGYLGIEPAFAAFLGTETASPQRRSHCQAQAQGIEILEQLWILFISLSFCMLCFVYSFLPVCHFCLLLGRSVFLVYYTIISGFLNRQHVRSSLDFCTWEFPSEGSLPLSDSSLLLVLFSLLCFPSYSRDAPELWSPYLDHSLRPR